MWCQINVSSEELLKKAQLTSVTIDAAVASGN
jgi:hypothetical protein